MWILSRLLNDGSYQWFFGGFFLTDSTRKWLEFVYLVGWNNRVTPPLSAVPNGYSQGSMLLMWLLFFG
jgi:hypothetical protein